MKPLQTIPWVDPLTFAASIQDEYCVLLYSGIRTSYSGRFSYLAYGIKDIITANDFSELENTLTHDKPWYENAWFGYLGYGLKNTLEKLPPDAEPSYIPLPDLCMMRFATIWRFDHESHTVEGWSDIADTPIPGIYKSSAIPSVNSLKSNMSNDSYQYKVQQIIDAIHAGDLYQANLTRKFYGEFSASIDNFSLFAKLCEVSPAPYSAYIRMKDIGIASSSPEMFIKIGEDGAVETRPIKGTSPRMSNPADDRKSFEQLANSTKDKAENLMITDLMRNDLSRTCTPGSIQVKDMFAITSHSNVHHMASTVMGYRRKEYTTLDTIKACFPPGSMTGAPKIKAIKLCSALENMARGVYSGVIGFFDGAGTCEMSVVIRTIITQNDKFEFQVGGGIVADSTPKGEMQETFDKAKGIVNTLNIPPEMFKTL